jgi:hypothetical protein
MMFHRTYGSAWAISAFASALFLSYCGNGFAASPVFTYVAGPQGCTTPPGYPDAAVCIVPNEVPLARFPVPPVGGTYVDANFGATVKMLSSFSTNHGYSTPSAFSANGKYVAVAQNDQQVTVIDAANGAVTFAARPGSVTGDTIRWDSYTDDTYYFFSGPRIISHTLSTNKTVTVNDYSIDGHAFTSIYGGGTGDTSKDNWLGFWAPNEHQVCIINLGTVRTYCADYNAAFPNSRVPVSNVDFVNVSKGVDSSSGKRYVLLMSNPAIAVFSVNESTGKLDFQYRGPEVPVDFQVTRAGNNDGVCDPGESCLSAYHSDVFEDSQGRQYLAYVADLESPCQRQITTSLISAGPSMLISVSEGGGRTDVAPLHFCGGGSIELWAENHTGCARKAPYCTFSTNYTEPRDPTDLLTPINRTTHLSEIIVMRENGAELRRLAQTRSLQFTNDSYWSFVRASISPNGSAVLFDSNFGYPNRGEAAALVYTGFGQTALTTDSTPPAIGMVSPAGGASISSNVTISAAASDNVGVAGVQFKLDGVKLGAELLAAPYKMVFDSTKVSNGQHALSATARDAAGNVAASQVVNVTVKNLYCSQVALNIFNGCYYDNIDFTNLKYVRKDSQINFTWGAGSPAPGMAQDYFSALWRGYFYFQTAPYTFSVTADDGFRLYVDGVKILEHWANQPATTYTARKAMSLVV